MHSFLCLSCRPECEPAYVEAILPARRCDLVSRPRVCTRPRRRVYTGLYPPTPLLRPHSWPILLLFLDNGCIYTLILDYAADLQESFSKGLAPAVSRSDTRKHQSERGVTWLPRFGLGPEASQLGCL